MGFAVTGADFSEEALKRLRRFADRSGLNVNTIHVDLSQDDSLAGLGRYNNVIVNHYRLGPKQISSIHNNLWAGGILFINGSAQNHAAHSSMRVVDLIVPGDLEALKHNFTATSYYEYQDERGSFVACVFKRK